MAIADDISFDYINKIVKRSGSPSSTVYSANAVYSYVMDTFDELVQLDNTVPMSAETPTSYTMRTGWYLQEELTKYINGGAIQTNGYDDEIRTIICGSPSWVSFVSGDIGATLTGTTTTDTGTILDYDNSAYKIWIRMDDSGDTFDNAAETVSSSVTGSGLTTAVSTTGEHLFANPYTLGTLEGTPQLYIYQNDSKITGWWSTGHFDILVKVTESDVDVDSRYITVFGRNWTDQNTVFRIQLTSAGQNAVPLGNADDLNNQTAAATVEDLTDGTTATIAIDFAYAVEHSYDIGDGAGAQDYEVQIDCDSRRLSDVYEVMKWWTREGSTTQLEEQTDSNFINGEAYRFANSSYAEVVPSPFGTFAGGTMFGARSVYFTNLHADDAQAFQLIDKAGVTRNPPDYQAFSVTGIISGVRCAIYKDTGAGNGVVDKAQYTSHATNNGTGNTTYEIQEAIPTSTPSSGTIILVNTGTGVEEAIAYTSWTGSIFTLGAAHAGGYAGDDTAYVPYVYEESTGTSITETSTIYTSDINVVARARLKGYLPVQATGIYSATGYSAAINLVADAIVT